MRQAFKIAVCIFVVVALLLIYQWRAHIARYHRGIDVFEMVEMSRVAIYMDRIYEQTIGPEPEVVPGRELNEELLFRRWLEESDQYTLESFSVLQFDIEGRMIDLNGRPLRIYYLGDGTEAIEDRCLDRLRHRFRFAVWSVGQNGFDECGSGDDVFYGVDHNGRLWHRDPSIWVRFKRRGRLLE